MPLHLCVDIFLERSERFTENVCLIFTNEQLCQIIYNHNKQQNKELSETSFILFPLTFYH